MLQGCQPLERPIRLLLVEDNRGDALLFQRALTKTGFSHQVTIASTGESALRLVEDAQQETQPDLIVLDLNLPGISGHQVLNALKTHDDHKRIPVFIFSSSRAPMDVLEGYNAHANSYIVKPYNSDDLFRVADCIRTFCQTLTAAPWNHGAQDLRAFS